MKFLLFANALLFCYCRYNLFDKFSEVVKGFANCHSFAQTHCKDTMVTFSLRVLSKVLLDKDHIDTSKATERAKLAYDVS